MPTPKELVEAVADALGVPEATVNVHDRNLLQAGLRTSAGRGRALVRVTTTDAANLLIAVAGSRSVKDSVKTVNQYGKLWGPFGWDWLKFEPVQRAENVLLPVPEVLQLVRGHRFTDGLAALIESAASGSLQRIASETVGEPVNLLLPGPQKLRIHVILKGPLPFDEISIWHKDQRETHVYAGHRSSVIEMETGEHRKHFDPPKLNKEELEKMDLSYETSFSHRTIMKIGNLLKQ